MLRGPFSTDSVDSYVSSPSPGVYILSKDARTAAYVGRSDTDVGSRIKQYVTEGYTHFWFEYATSPRDAYLKECEYYHKYNPPDNKNHPAVPFGTNWRCPIIGCPWS
jgi:hypothetical protein